jgi:hypothetical protein
MEENACGDMYHTSAILESLTVSMFATSRGLTVESEGTSQIISLPSHLIESIKYSQVFF